MTGRNRCDVSVVISTRNRCCALRRTIESLLRQEAGGTAYEVIVVDNNSSDATQSVLQSPSAEGEVRVRSLFEPRIGVSHGRNAGVEIALAPLIAFTDDDVYVDARWVANIKRAFDENPHVDYVSGKVVADWEVRPPRWLAPETWGGPCVLRDRGDAPLRSAPGRFFPGWATVNLAIRRSLFDRVGLFSGEFERGEDLDLILRVWRVGSCGMYAPDVIVTHRVPAERMTKAYHRQWHTREGEIRARLRFKEIFDRQGNIVDPPVRRRTLFGTALFVYRELLDECRQWTVAAARGRTAATFRHECQVRQLVSYIRSRHALSAVHQTRHRMAWPLSGGPRPDTRSRERLTSMMGRRL